MRGWREEGRGDRKIISPGDAWMHNLSNPVHGGADCIRKSALRCSGYSSEAAAAAVGCVAYAVLNNHLCKHSGVIARCTMHAAIEEFPGRGIPGTS